MTATLNRLINSPSLTLRAIRSSLITVAGFGSGQVIRLASNLILTRLLYPEAFGTMAIVLVFMIALQMFSDVGIGASIMQSSRGDDPEFLDTAWTIQIIRGAILWVAALALAVPIAAFYGHPELAWYLPVAALSHVISGFYPIRLQTAHRHLIAGRVTMIDLASQTVGIIVAIVLALLFRNVWALVISGVVTALTQLILLNVALPGLPNRLRWEPQSARELIHFGKWIFLSTVSGFVGLQADKVILVKFISLAQFGLYNIGYFLASFPMLLGSMVIGRVLIPVYRESPPLASAANRARLRKMRFAMSGLLTTLVAILVFSGVWLVDLMYDDRYLVAGGILVLIAMLEMPALISLTCDQSALAAGDSRRFFVLTLVRAILVVTFLLAGLQMGGLVGALLGQGLANLAAYPVVVWLVRPHGAWDPLHDAVFFAIGAVIFASGWWFNADAIAALAQMGVG